MKVKNIALLSAVALLASCSNKGMGLSKRPPDEFMVVSNPPLYIPPSFDLNDPNKPSEKTPQVNKSDLTGSDKQFLQTLDRHSISSNEDGEPQQGAVRSFLSKIRGKNSAEVIDPAHEKERIAKNKADNKPINEGVVKTRKEGGSTISRIIGRDEE